MTALTVASNVANPFFITWQRIRLPVTLLLGPVTMPVPSTKHLPFLLRLDKSCRL